jgi:lipopolysaccharide transport system ATP-binding protein
MSQAAICVDNLSKWYQLGAAEQSQQNLREVVSSLLASPFRRLRRAQGQAAEGESLWALKEVSFSIQQGEVVGVIGRNGAGKSTLLKILSRIVEPTTGTIRLHGRVGSLLEVGTGFHPELTGRENIYLNGAILGMSRRELQRQFDAIVEFAGVERFLDTPVKRYSSGMYIRLAFAVAAHLDPEILIVDEVLAVGDAEFQQKCLGKMQDVARSGRTVLFVSHNMAAIRQLCSSAILLSKGTLLARDSTQVVLREYLTRRANPLAAGTINQHGLQFVEACLTDRANGCPTDYPVFNDDYTLTLSLYAHRRFGKGCVAIRVFDEMGTPVSTLCSIEEGQAPFDFDGPVQLTFDLPRLQLFPARYTATISVYRYGDEPPYLEVEDALSFEVQPAIVRDAMWPYKKVHGVVRISDGVSVSMADASYVPCAI